jgi:hypothetical protein
VAPWRDALLIAADLIEQHVPDRGRLVWSDGGRQVYELREDQCSGVTVTTIADGVESVSHVCGVDGEALR